MQTTEFQFLELRPGDTVSQNAKDEAARAQDLFIPAQRMSVALRDPLLQRADEIFKSNLHLV